jgi:hypothetical protein
MPNESKRMLAKTFLSAIFGIALGLFVGILVMGTLIRLIFSFIFGWGDSAPMWGVWTEGIMIVGMTLASLYFSVKWTMGTNKKS